MSSMALDLEVMVRINNNSSTNSSRVIMALAVMEVVDMIKVSRIRSRVVGGSGVKVVGIQDGEEVVGLMMNG